MAYTKLDSTLTDSTIWQAPDTTRLVWITMLSMADQNGYVGASVPGLASRARVSIDACVAALESFEGPDPWSRTKDNEGRRIAPADGGWVLLNHAKYRAAQSADDRRERSRLAMQALRAKRKAEAQQTQTVAPRNNKLAKLTQAEADTETTKKESAPGSPAHAHEPARATRTHEEPPPETAGFTPTPAGAACKAMREAGLAQVNPGDPRLTALLEQGATLDELAGMAAEAAAHKPPKGFAWVLKALENRRAEAHALALAPPAAPQPKPGELTGRQPLYVAPPPLTAEEKAAADAKRLEVMAKMRSRRKAAA